MRVYINRVEDLSYHLLEFPETRGVAVKVRTLNILAFSFSSFPSLLSSFDSNLSDGAQHVRKFTLRFDNSDTQCLKRHAFIHTLW